MVKLFQSLLLCIILPAMAFASQPDSVGTKIINGQLFIIHEVEHGETLYAISRKYDVALAVLIEHNPAARQGLNIGDLLNVLYNRAANPVGQNASTIHRVEAGETLYGLSKKYGVKISEIQSWNNLPDFILRLGQELIVSKPGASSQIAEIVPEVNQTPIVTQDPVIEETQRTETAEASRPSEVKYHTVRPSEGIFSVAKQYEITVAEIQRWNKLDNFTIIPGQRLAVGNPGELDVVADPGITEPELAQTENVIARIAEPYVPVGWTAEEYKSFQELPATYETMTESGIAAMIEGSTNTKKYLALHRTAPVGTIIGVRNEMNDQMVFVRVLGKLPDIGANDRIIMRMSKAAYDNLSAIDQRFRVELTYYK